MPATTMDPRPKHLYLPWLSSAALSLLLGCAPPTSSTPAKGSGENWCKSGPPAAQLTQPELIKREPAYYATEAQVTGVKSPLSVRCILLADGRVVDCKLLDPAPAMEQSVYRALLNWRFKPVTENGVPTPVEVNLTVPLTYSESGAPPPPAEAASASPGAAPAAPAAPPPDGQTPANPLPFGVGMERPKLLASTPPVFSPEARDACIQGFLLAKCVITTTGALANCAIIKPLPYMDQPVLDALKTYRFSPVVFQGKPVNVEYVLSFAFKADAAKPH